MDKRTQQPEPRTAAEMPEYLEANDPRVRNAGGSPYWNIALMQPVSWDIPDPEGPVLPDDPVEVVTYRKEQWVERDEFGPIRSFLRWKKMS